jgi:hypothetical protein
MKIPKTNFSFRWKFVDQTKHIIRHPHICQQNHFATVLLIITKQSPFYCCIHINIHHRKRSFHFAQMMTKSLLLCVLIGTTFPSVLSAWMMNPTPSANIMTQQQQQRYPPTTLLGSRTPSQLYADAATTTTAAAAAAAAETVEETTSQKETFEFTVRSFWRNMRRHPQQQFKKFVLTYKRY